MKKSKKPRELYHDNITWVPKRSYKSLCEDLSIHFAASETYRGYWISERENRKKLTEALRDAVRGLKLSRIRELEDGLEGELTIQNILFKIQTQFPELFKERK